MNNLVIATVQELATSIRYRRVSATEVLEAYLAQITRHNPTLNAIVTLDEERARARAKEADTALAEVTCGGRSMECRSPSKMRSKPLGCGRLGAFPRSLSMYRPTMRR